MVCFRKHGFDRHTSCFRAALIHRSAARRRTRHTSASGRPRKAPHDVQSCYPGSNTTADLQPQELHLRNWDYCPNKRGHLCARFFKRDRNVVSCGGRGPRSPTGAGWPPATPTNDSTTSPSWSTRTPALRRARSMLQAAGNVLTRIDARAPPRPTPSTRSTE